MCTGWTMEFIYAFLFSSVDKNEVPLILKYLFIYSLFSFGVVGHWRRQCHQNTDDGKLPGITFLFVSIWLIFISAITIFVHMLMYLSSSLQCWNSNITILIMSNTVIYQKALRVRDRLLYVIIFFLGLLFVHQIRLATHLYQIHHPYPQFLIANWLLINLQGVCFAKWTFCMHKNQSHRGFHYLIHLHVFANPQNTFPIFLRQSIKLTY